MLAFLLFWLAGNLVDSASVPFITRWNVSETSKSITLPLTVPVSLNISWGDNTTESATNSTFVHVYDVAGIYDVSLLGDMMGFRFNSIGDATKLIAILDWGDSFIVDSSSVNVFAGCVNLQTFNPVGRPVFFPQATLKGMFMNTSVNSPVNFWDVTNVTSLAFMFSDAKEMTQSVNLVNAHNVSTIECMFRGATKFNATINITGTGNVQSMANMFRRAITFNQPINFDGSNLLDIEYMFRDALAFNSIVNLTNTTKLKNAWNVFENATAFNQPISFLGPTVEYVDYMFSYASSFNQPIIFSANSLNKSDFMFEHAVAFNSPVNFSAAPMLEFANSMFQDAISFNQSVTILNSNRLKSMESMFRRAVNFNQPVNFSTPNTTTMMNMFDGAVSFNQPVNFRGDTLTTTANMFRGATSFNQPVVLSGTRQVTSMASMFANATSFNQTVNIDRTQSVSDMSNMFLGVMNFEQDLASWDTGQVTSCSNFCYQCGLPSFPFCRPCASGVRLQRGTMSVCNCPRNDCNSTGTTTTTNLCELATVSADLEIACLSNRTNSTPTPNVKLISPLFNITTDSNSSSFVFTLPIDPSLTGRVSQACYGEELSCEWQDPESLKFQQSGCAVSQANVDMGSGVVGTECTCVHLTVFAIALRSGLRAAPLCHAQDVDYALIGLYAALALILVIQLFRILRYKISRNSAIQHSLLLLACALRVVYLVAKPVISSLAGLVLLGLLPSAISLSLFIHILLAWASLQTVTLGPSPFARFRIPFIVVVSLVFMVVVALVVLVALLPESQTEVVQAGSYVLAALYAVVCVLVLASGLGLRRTLGSLDSVNSGPQDWRSLFRQRLLIATMALSSCLLLVACLWVAAVQEDILTSSAATLAATTSFYVFDWLSLCVLTWLFSKAVGDAIKKRDQFTKSDSRLTKTEMSVH